MLPSMLVFAPLPGVSGLGGKTISLISDQKVLHGLEVFCFVFCFVILLCVFV